MIKQTSFKILVIDDDIYLCDLIKFYLNKEGLDTIFAHNGQEGLNKLRDETPDLVLLDIMLPGMDGWTVCREIQKISDIPVIMLTAKGEDFDKVLGLELGADDYVVKPFNFKELIARIKAVLRRYHSRTFKIDQIVYPGLLVDIQQYLVKLKGNNLDLSPKEIELLYLLAKNPNQVFTRQQLLDNIWGYDYTGGTRTIDVHIERLRKKLNGTEEGAWQIKTVWGVGYKFEVK